MTAGACVCCCRVGAFIAFPFTYQYISLIDLISPCRRTFVNPILTFFAFSAKIEGEIDRQRHTPHGSPVIALVSIEEGKAEQTMNEEEPEYITIAEARTILGVSKPRMADLLREGALVAEENPLDKRSKLVKRADVEALARRAGRLGKNDPAIAA
jgi:hypothetical protein